MRTKILVLALLVGISVIYNLSGRDDDSGVVAPQVLTADRLAAAPDLELTPLVMADLWRRIRLEQADWTRFQDPARSVWLTATFEDQLRDLGFLRYYAENTLGGSVADVQDAYARLGATELADLLAKAQVIAQGPGRAAIDASRTRSGEASSPPADPFRSLDEVVFPLWQRSKVTVLRAAYIRNHSADILAAP